MARSTVDIFNMALGWLGGAQLTGVESTWEKSTPGTLCKNLFPVILADALEAHDWSFALRRADLPLKSTPGGQGYQYRYGRPADCLRLVELEGAGHGRGPCFITDGQDILTDEAPARLLYVANITDPNQWTAAFSLALSWGLAAFLSTAQKNDSQQQELCARNYQIQLAEAWVRDMSTQNPRMPLSPWQSARAGDDAEGGY